MFWSKIARHWTASSGVYWATGFGGGGASLWSTKDKAISRRLSLARMGDHRCGSRSDAVSRMRYRCAYRLALGQGPHWRAKKTVRRANSDRVRALSLFSWLQATDQRPHTDWNQNAQTTERLVQCLSRGRKGLINLLEYLLRIFTRNTHQHLGCKHESYGHLTQRMLTTITFHLTNRCSFTQLYKSRSFSA